MPRGVLVIPGANQPQPLSGGERIGAGLLLGVNELLQDMQVRGTIRGAAEQFRALGTPEATSFADALDQDPLRQAAIAEQLFDGGLAGAFAQMRAHAIEQGSSEALQNLLVSFQQDPRFQELDDAGRFTTALAHVNEMVRDLPLRRRLEIAEMAARLTGEGTVPEGQSDEGKRLFDRLRARRAGVPEEEIARAFEAPAEIDSGDMINLIKAGATAESVQRVKETGDFTQLSFRAPQAEPFSNADLFRIGDQFRKDAGNFQDVQEAWGRIVSVADEALVGLNPAAQQALVVVLNKILDPGSVVRESEFGRIFTAEGGLGRVQLWIERLMSGQQLTPQLMQDILATAERIYEAEREGLLAREQDTRRQLSMFGVPEAKQGVALPDMLGRFREDKYGQNPDAQRLFRSLPSPVERARAREATRGNVPVAGRPERLD